MRFYQSGLETIVWDPENDRPLVEFVNGIADIKDKAVQAKLKELGYATAAPEVGPAGEDFESEDQGSGKPRVSRLKG